MFFGSAGLLPILQILGFPTELHRQFGDTKRVGPIWRFAPRKFSRGFWEKLGGSKRTSSSIRDNPYSTLRPRLAQQVDDWQVLLVVPASRGVLYDYVYCLRARILRIYYYIVYYYIVILVYRDYTMPASRGGHAMPASRGEKELHSQFGDAKRKGPIWRFAPRKFGRGFWKKLAGSKRTNSN